MRHLLPTILAFPVIFLAAPAFSENESIGTSEEPLKVAPGQRQLDLTGQWRCNDGGTYYVRQVGPEVWWYGRSADGGRSFSNVFHGRIQGDGHAIAGRWADVPMGRTLNSGQLTWRITGPSRLNAVSQTGGFSCNNLVR